MMRTIAISMILVTSVGFLAGCGSTQQVGYVDVAKIASDTTKGQEIDKNVNLSYSNFEELENKRQNYLKSKNKNDYMQKHLVEFVVSLSFDKVKEYIKDNQDIDKGFMQYVEDF